MAIKLETKLKNLPTQPGVYFFKDSDGKIIYIGKAAVLKNRVGSYFQKTAKDPKTTLLVADIHDLDWITVESEVEALFLESEFIKRYRPKYNIDLKDDKHWIYLKITSQAKFPVVSYVRRPMDDKSAYFGPFTSSDAVRRAMKMLRKIFPYVTHETLPPRACLQAHLGLCPNPEEGAIDSATYKRRNIRNLVLYLSGQQDKLMQQLEKDMQRAAKKRDFEAAGRARDQLRDLRALAKQMIFGDNEAFDLSRDQALVGLAERLGLPSAPRRIEAYDISHMQGSDNVASMIVFTDGVPNQDEYRRFKMRLVGNDDFAHMREVIQRRFSGKPLVDWAKPDLILIDGGKGQLSSALAVMGELGISIPAIGLAKREEEIIRYVGGASKMSSSTGKPHDVGAPDRGSLNLRDSQSEASSVNRSLSIENDNTGKFETILLPKDSHVLQLLQRVRDEAHRFAVTYHALLRGQRQTKSQLDDIPGVGPATRKRLIKQFGSLRGVKLASVDELAATVGSSKAKLIKERVG
ncbi:MAG TPA: excinuclease ABC subunit UvrC [Candidatus Saccharimonadales bacterium]|nr:excinuclease ABC subunit UvrC [Candidatus Saccharimonadales bacterium]